MFKHRKVGKNKPAQYKNRTIKIKNVLPITSPLKFEFQIEGLDHQKKQYETVDFKEIGKEKSSAMG